MTESQTDTPAAKLAQDIRGVAGRARSEEDLRGDYHHVSVKHLDAYLNELEWRFNERENPYLFRDTLKKLIGSQNLPYQHLIEQ